MTIPAPIHSPDLVQKPPARLHTNPRNARTHSRAQIKQIADSIRAFGFTNPILVDEDDRVLAGHGRLAAAKRLGLEAVPTLRLLERLPDTATAASRSTRPLNTSQWILRSGHPNRQQAITRDR